MNLGPPEIAAALPHRYPILLLDRLTEIVPGERLTALKAVTYAESWYAADLGAVAPGPEAYPVVLLVESWCQAAALLVAWDRPNPDVRTGAVMLGGAINGVEFGGDTRPGDVVEHRVRMLRATADAAILTGESVVAGEPVLKVAQFVMAMRPIDVLRPSLAGAGEPR
ncbi:3-hydroxyacyl-ACP dehydratase FabZ family protein [Micromonospora sp. NPDC005203]|uniref:3-hydroxyacyl-ACP dehydratase FabZ family protein n=1 Tax=Micromonospora sp. NPDC005203 TaxID=3364226 RepID=UPI0036A91692